ncbi:MAG TPA: DMT family transporter, partial [Thermoanaerobaculia bacterium]|nr:DMT family transporter [Thermoanaerobaculia bacterium]
LLGWLVAGETVTPRTLVATVVIVSSVALIIRHGASRSARRNEEDEVPVEDDVAPPMARTQGGTR